MASHDPAGESRRLSDLLRIIPGSAVDLSSYDTKGAPGFPADGKKDAERLRLAMGDELSDLQERLFDDGRSFPETAKSVLVVLQGMDTSGKGGTISHVFGLMDPAGLEPRAFKAPTPEGASTTSSGASPTRFRARARSASSTAASTRTC